MADTKDKKWGKAWEFLQGKFEEDLERLNNAFYHVLNTEGSDAAAPYADNIMEHLWLFSNAAVIVDQKNYYEKINQMLTEKIADSLSTSLLVIVKHSWA